MPTDFDFNSRIYISGHRGMVGSAFVRRLQSEGYRNLLTVEKSEVDLRNQAAVEAWFHENQPELVFHAAGRVGGILANSQQPADFLYDNLMIHATVLHAAKETGVKKLLYLGSSCIYPRDCPQPIQEEDLLSGFLEPTNYGYAIAKISGLLACRAYHSQYGCRFLSVMPTNLYGPHDNFDLQSSHVLPALIRRFDEARRAGESSITVWGTGSPRREFLHVDDLVDACLFLMKTYEKPEFLNVGTGQDLEIRELAHLIRNAVHPNCEIRFDPAYPDGTPRKQLDVSRLHKLGWKHSIELKEGIAQTYAWYLEHRDSARGL